jgi:hypothetical protein
MWKEISNVKIDLVGFMTWVWLSKIKFIKEFIKIALPNWNQSNL